MLFMIPSYHSSSYLYQTSVIGLTFDSKNKHIYIFYTNFVMSPKRRQQCFTKQPISLSVISPLRLLSTTIQRTHKTNLMALTPTQNVTKKPSRKISHIVIFLLISQFPVTSNFSAPIG